MSHPSAIKNCQICLQTYDVDKEWQYRDQKHRERISMICTKYLYSDIRINWSRESSEKDLQFCCHCLQRVEQISKLHDETELIKSTIETFVQSFTIESIKCRKEIRKTICTSLMPENDVEPSGTQKCVACFTNYRIREMESNELTLEEKKNILEQCQEYLYTDFLSSSNGFDWSTATNESLLPFCFNCFMNIDIICVLGNNIKKTDVYKKGFVDGFLLNIFNSRETLKNINATNSNISSSLPVSFSGGIITILNGKRKRSDYNSYSNSIESSLDTNFFNTSSDGPRIINTYSILTQETKNYCNNSIEITGKQNMTNISDSIQKVSAKSGSQMAHPIVKDAPNDSYRKSFKCIHEKCKKTFETKRKLIHHITAGHNYQCKKCAAPATFVPLNQLKFKSYIRPHRCILK